MGKNVVVDIERARQRRAAAKLGVRYDHLDEPSEREKAALLMFHAAIESLKGGRTGEDIGQLLERLDLVLDALSAQANP